MGASEGVPAFTGAVLTGGASRRFGSDKAVYRIEDETLAERVCRALREAGETGTRKERA